MLILAPIGLLSLFERCRGPEIRDSWTDPAVGALEQFYKMNKILDWEQK